MSCFLCEPLLTQQHYQEALMQEKMKMKKKYLLEKNYWPQKYDFTFFWIFWLFETSDYLCCEINDFQSPSSKCDLILMFNAWTFTQLSNHSTSILTKNNKIINKKLTVNLTCWILVTLHESLFNLDMDAGEWLNLIRTELNGTMEKTKAWAILRNEMAWYLGPPPLPFFIQGFFAMKNPFYKAFLLLCVLHDSWNFSSGQRNLIKTFYKEANTQLITKIALKRRKYIFGWLR